MAGSTSDGGQKGKMDDASASLAEKMDAIKADLADLADRLADLGIAHRDRASEAAADRFDDVRRRGRRHADALRGKADDIEATAESLVEDRPMAALGIAAGLGFVLGLVLSRR